MYLLLCEYDTSNECPHGFSLRRVHAVVTVKVSHQRRHGFSITAATREASCSDIITSTFDHVTLPSIIPNPCRPRTAAWTLKQLNY